MSNEEDHDSSEEEEVEAEEEGEKEVTEDLSNRCEEVRVKCTVYCSDGIAPQLYTL